MKIKDIIEKLDGLLSSGDVPGAEAHLLACREEAVREGNDRARLTIANELEGIYRQTGRAEEAVETAEEALGIARALGLFGTTAYASVLLNCGTACVRAGQHEKAEDCFRQAEDILINADQEDSWLMASLLNNRANLFQDRGLHEDALRDQNRSLSILEILENCDPQIAAGRTNTAYSLMALGRFGEAEERLTAAMSYYDGPAGVKDPHACSALAACGELAWRNKDYPEAERQYTLARERAAAVFGENDFCRTMDRNIRRVREASGRNDED